MPRGGPPGNCRIIKRKVDDMKSGQLTLAATAAALAIASASVTLADDPSRERLAYEIVMSNPGDRSQGWGGTLFWPDGTPLEMRPGSSVQTNFGKFVPAGPCPRPTIPCGFVEERMYTHYTNTPMGPTPWRYRLHIRSGCYRSEKLRGELIRGGQSLGGRPGDTIETPMGTFEWRTEEDERGWLHRALRPQHMPMEGTWPCPPHNP